MEEYKSVVKGTAWYLSAQIIVQGGNLLFTGIVTYFILPEIYGEIALFTFYNSIVKVVIGCGIPAFVTRFYHMKGRTASELIYNSYTVCFLLFGIYFLAIWPIFHAYYSDTSLYIILVSEAFLFCLNDVNIGYYVTSKKYIEVFKIMVLTFLLKVGIVSFFFFRDTFLVEYWFIAYFLAQALVLLTNYSLFKGLKLVRPSMQIIKQAFKYGLPITVHSFLLLGINQLDRVFLDYYTNKTALGLFSFAFNISAVLFLFLNQIRASITPNFLEAMNSGSDEKTFTRMLTKFAIILMLGFYAFAGMVEELISKDYDGIKEVMIPLAVSQGILAIYMIYFYYLDFYLKLKYLYFLTFVAFLINTGLNFWFIPEYGIEGAVYSKITTNFIYGSIVFVFASKLHPRIYLKENNHLVLCSALILVLVSLGLSNLYELCIGFLLMGIYGYFFLNKDIRLLFNLIQKKK